MRAGIASADSLDYAALLAPARAAPPQSLAAAAVTLTFQNGVAGYTGTVDTNLQESKPTTSFGNATSVSVDSDSPGGSGKDDQVLLRFDNLFGSGTGQIPVGAVITSATLTLNTTSAGDGASLHRLLAAFSNATTWTSAGSGIQLDGAEAVAAADATVGKTSLGTITINVTASLQAWASGATNFGWLFNPAGSDGWDFSSAEGSIKPKLQVTFSTDGGGNTPPLATDDTAQTTTGHSVVIAVLSNDSDANGDSLSVSGVASAAHGTVAINANGTLTYQPFAGYNGVDGFDYTISDGHGGSDTGHVTVTIGGAHPLSESYIATTGITGSPRQMEHDNASKSFYHDGHWWAVIPNGSTWVVHKFTGSEPSGGGVGGFVTASPNLQSAAYRADVVFDEAHDKAYVLNFSGSQSRAFLTTLTYNDGPDTWSISSTVQLSGSGGKLSGAQWSQNEELALGLDANGKPMITAVGPSDGGGQQGLFVAYATSDNLSTWADFRIDAGTTSTGGSNGDSKADFVSFRQNGVNKIGIVYSADNGSSDSWKISYHDATPGTNYSTGWSTSVINTSVAIDNHISAVSDGETIWFAMKDDKDTVWVQSGVPGSWSAPVKVATGDPSRPTLVLDDTHDQLYVLYQQHTRNPYGSIYMKVTDADHMSFDPGDAGTLIVTTGGKGDLIDPQGPAHVVGDETGGSFFIFARNEDSPSIWYNDVTLA